MNIRTVIIWIIVLVLIEQIIKLVISINYRDISFEIIPSLLDFKPTLNNKSFYWLSLMNIEVGRWARFTTGIIFLGILCMLYLYMKKISKKGYLLDVAFIFGFAGLISSISDNLFFGGSWDYVYVKPLFIFDLKDLYLNCFAILFIIFCYLNRKKINKIKIKDIIFTRKVD